MHMEHRNKATVPESEMPVRMRGSPGGLTGESVVKNTDKSAKCGEPPQIELFSSSFTADGARLGRRALHRRSEPIGGLARICLRRGSGIGTPVDRSERRGRRNGSASIV